MDDLELQAQEAKIIQQFNDDFAAERYKAIQAESQPAGEKESSEESSEESEETEESSEETEKKGKAQAKEGKAKEGKDKDKGVGLSVEQLRALAKEGKGAELFQALGVDPKGLNVPSDRYAKLRQMQQRHNADMAARESAVSAKEQLLTNVLAAKTALDNGDIVRALELFTGSPLDVVSEKAMRQKLNYDPEAAKRDAELERYKKAEAERLKQADLERVQQAEKAKVERYLGQVKDAFLSGDNPLFAKLAETDPDFVPHVYRMQLDVAKKEGIDIPADEAAERLVAAVSPIAKMWVKALGLLKEQEDDEGKNSDRAAKQPAKTKQAGKALDDKKKKAGSNPTKSKSKGELTEADLMAQLMRDIEESRKGSSDEDDED